jgi:hypothetical protein
MANPIDEAIKALEADWPNWQVWTVSHAVGRRITWCARRWDWKPGDAVLNAATAEHLAEYLEDAASKEGATDA